MSIQKSIEGDAASKRAVGCFETRVEVLLAGSAIRREEGYRGGH